MKRSIVAQLIEIAKIELHIPVRGARVMITGQTETAKELALLLENEGVVTEKAPYDLVFLLEQPEDDALFSLLAQNSLIIDASPAKSENQAVFDGKGSFRRIRVVSLLKT